jgi:hypothetical protein
MPSVYTIVHMKKQPEPKGQKKSVHGLRDVSLLIRVQGAEKETFQDAANYAGVPLSAWVRERLRQAAIKELEGAGLPIALLKGLKIG